MDGLRAGQLVVYAVADGMGGHEGGDVASYLAIKGLEEAVTNKERYLEKEYIETNSPRLYKEFFKESNEKILSAKEDTARLKEMGTTLTAAFIYDERVVIGHVGDSRAYLIKDNKMEQITRDHSLVNELLRSGELNNYEAENHPQKNVLTNALGISGDIQVDIYNYDFSDETVLLLCSDGLTSHLYDEEILTIIKRHNSIENAAKRLVKSSYEAGGFDNITVCLIAPKELSEIFRGEIK
ncbi:Serine/threonine phosphatase stp [Natranaerofaba carboxydovora]|nr:Serine/threonine phosphatase stp [Natranaerofaba carboxydovora]